MPSSRHRCQRTASSSSGLFCRKGVTASHDADDVEGSQTLGNSILIRDLVTENRNVGSFANF